MPNMGTSKVHFHKPTFLNFEPWLVSEDSWEAPVVVTTQQKLKKFNSTSKDRPKTMNLKRHSTDKVSHKYHPRESATLPVSYISLNSTVNNSFIDAAKLASYKQKKTKQGIQYFSRQAKNEHLSVSGVASATGTPTGWQQSIFYPSRKMAFETQHTVHYEQGAVRIELKSRKSRIEGNRLVKPFDKEAYVSRSYIKGNSCNIIIRGGTPTYS